MASAMHEFAFFVPNLRTHIDSTSVNVELTIDEPEMVTRVKNVVRLRMDDICILFDRTTHARVRIVAAEKKQLTIFVLFVGNNIMHRPSITCLLPVLKRGSSLFTSIPLFSNVLVCGVCSLNADTSTLGSIFDFVIPSFLCLPLIRLLVALEGICLSSLDIPNDSASVCAIIDNTSDE